MFSSVSFTSHPRTILPVLEPTWTKGKLRRLGVDAGSRSGLAKIGEFLTGLQPDHELIGACRSRSTIIAYMASQAACRGRRGFGLNLPPTWPEDGIYEILRVQDGQVIVQQKFSREQHGISIAVLPAFQNVADLVIRQNWSEVKAAIESRTSEESKEIQSYSFGQLFQRHGSPQPLPKQVLTTAPPRMKRFKVQPDTSPEGEKQLLPATKKSKVHTCSPDLLGLEPKRPWVQSETDRSGAQRSHAKANFSEALQQAPLPP